MVRILILILLLTSCSTSKEIVTSTNERIPKPTYIQPDTCLTDRQFKAYLKFVKDSMKIENKKVKIEYRYTRDTIRIIEKAKIKNVKQEEKTERKEIEQENKTVRTEVRQENKTERAKLNRWLIFFIGMGIGVLSRYVVKVVGCNLYK